MISDALAAKPLFIARIGAVTFREILFFIRAIHISLRQRAFRKKRLLY